MKQISRDSHIYMLEPEASPAITIDSSDDLMVETWDAFEGERGPADMPHPNVPDLRVPASPLKLTKTPPSIRRHPPGLGQDNEEVLAESGYDAGQISKLREKGVISG